MVEVSRVFQNSGMGKNKNTISVAESGAQLQSRRYESHFLELSEEPKEHLLRIDALMKSEVPCLGCIRHYVVIEVEDRFSKLPSSSLLEGIVEKIILFHESLPERFFV
jgi:hypothetical protein